MATTLEVSASVDLTKFRADLNTMETEMKKVGSKGITMKPKMDTSEIKK